MIYLKFFNNLYPLDRKIIDKSDLLIFLVKNQIDEDNQDNENNEDIIINGDDLFFEINNTYERAWEYVYNFYHLDYNDFDILYNEDYDIQFKSIKIITFFNLKAEENPQITLLLMKISRGDFTLEKIIEYYYDIQLLPIGKFIADLFIISQYNLLSDLTSDLIEELPQYENSNFNNWNLKHSFVKRYMESFLLFRIKNPMALTSLTINSRYPQTTVKFNFNVDQINNIKLVENIESNYTFNRFNKNPYIINIQLLNRKSDDLKKSIYDGTFPSNVTRIKNQRELFGKEFIRLLCFLNPNKVVYEYTELSGNIKYVVSSNRFDKFLTLNEYNLPVDSNIDVPDSINLRKYKTILEIFGFYMTIGDTVYHSDIYNFKNNGKLIDYIYFKFFLNITKCKII